MSLDHILSKLQRVQRNGSGYKASCPVPGHGRGNGDQNPSLSVDEGENGIPLLYCHAGCKPEDILEALGLNQGTEKKASSRFNVIAEYNYTDAAGKFLYQVARFEPKEFRPRRKNPGKKYGWEYGLGEVKPVLYFLPEVAAAVQAGETIFLAEGEKDVESLRSLGLNATSKPFGTCKSERDWKGQYTEALKGAHVVIVPDNDDPGRKHAKIVGKKLYSKAASLKVLELPNLPEAGDVSDWIHAGGTREQLEDLARACPEYVPPADEKKGKKVVSMPSSFADDEEAARRLVNLHGPDLKYCDPWKKWLVWDGKRWVNDDTLEVVRRAKDAINKILIDAAEIEDDEERDKLIDFNKKYRYAHKLRAMLETAKPELPIRPEDMDQGPLYLNCLNGTADFKESTFRPHKKEDFITKLVPFEYKEDAKCPKWEAFINRIMDGNQELITFLRKAVGYSLTGLTDERCLFILYGKGKNGKSTFVETIAELLGDYAMRTPTETLMMRHNEGIPNDVARLKGARFVFASESEEGRRLAVSRIKDLTGGDTVAARFMRAEYFDFRPEFKLWLSTNHKPDITDSNDAIWDRIRLIPFTVTIPESERKPRSVIMAEFRKEMPGIMAWAVRGCGEWRKDGLGMPRGIAEAVKDYRHSMDTLGDFFEDCCVLGRSCTVTVKDLYETYRQWHEENGGPIKKRLGKKELGSQLRQRGFDVYAGNKNVKWWSGIGLQGDIVQEHFSEEDSENTMY